jgi:hypothetical protein
MISFCVAVLMNSKKMLDCLFLKLSAGFISVLASGKKTRSVSVTSLLSLPLIGQRISQQAILPN